MTRTPRFKVHDVDAKELEKLLTARPFEPFGIHMSDGSAYPIMHRDHVVFTQRIAHGGLGGGGNGRAARDVVLCAIVHIIRRGPVPKSPRKRK